MYSSDSLNALYTVSSTAGYRECLKHVYSINRRLKEEGISAPSAVSVDNVRKVYSYLGKPLDSIPTFHIGGTNGKVRRIISRK